MAGRRVLVIIPTYDEARNITEVLGLVRAAVPDADVLVVDAGSPDGTADLADAAGAELGQIRVLRQRARNGLGGAYREGFTLGLGEGYDVLVEMDADLSHDPADLPRLLAAFDDEVGLVIGSRYVPGGRIPNWPLHRRLLSRWANRYVRLVLGLPVADATAGYRAYRAEVLAACDYASTRADGYGFQVELAHRVARSGWRIVEVPITFHDRERGTSKMSGRIVVEAMALVTWWAVRDRLLRRRRQASAGSAA